MRRALLAAALLAAATLLTPTPAEAATGDIAPFTDEDLLNPRDVVAGPDGNLWFTSFQTSSVGRVTPAGVVTMYTDEDVTSPHGITVGPDDNLWFTDFGGSAIGRIEPDTGLITTFPDANLFGAQDIVTGPDGNLWFTVNQADRIGKVTTAGVITTFPSGDIDGPFDIATNGTDLYFTNFDGDSLGRITTAGAVSEINLTGLEAPSGLVFDPLSGIFLFAAAGNNRLGALLPGTSPAVTFLPPPSSGSISVPLQLAFGPEGDLWVTSSSPADIDRFDISTSTFHSVADPDDEIQSPWGITRGPDGNIWFTDVVTSSVNRLEVDSTPPEVTITTPADGSTYQRGQQVVVDYECSDAPDPQPTCEGDLADGETLTMAEAGAGSFTVSSTDAAGNTTTETANFTIAPRRCAGQDVTVDLDLGDAPTAGDDVILGRPVAETIDTLGGNDLVCAGGGADTVLGRAGNDKVYGGAGNDIVFGHVGNDRAYGGDGSDTLNGAAGLDVLEGGNQNDTLNGGTQRDVCKGQAGGGDRGTSCEVRSGIP